MGVCSKCEKSLKDKIELENHGCTKLMSCDCGCNTCSVFDTLQKAFAILGGSCVASAGLAVICSTGVVGIVLGGALVGFGFSISYQAINKLIRNERFNASECLKDSLYGSLNGVCMAGVKTVACPVSGISFIIINGIMSGLVDKVITEMKACVAKEKKLSDFGKKFDNNGNYLKFKTLVSWLACPGVSLARDCTSGLASDFQNVIIKSISNFVCGIVFDSGCQFVNLAIGNQKKYDFKRTFTTASFGITSAAASMCI